MALNTSSFFAGIGTVIVTVAVGLSAGVWMTNALVGKSDKFAATERRAPQMAIAIPALATPVAAAPAPRSEIQPVQDQPVAQIQSKPDDAMAKAKEDDLKRARVERKKAEQRKWARRQEQLRRQQRQQIESEPAPQFAQQQQAFGFFNH